jgi:aspartyl aminopeptidase
MITAYGVEVIDCGVPVLSMHAPYEAVSKVEVYMAYKIATLERDILCSFIFAFTVIY